MEPDPDWYVSWCTRVEQCGHDGNWIRLPEQREKCSECGLVRVNERNR